MMQRAQEEGKSKPPRVGMSTQFRTPEAVAEMEQCYGYEAVHGHPRPPPPPQEEVSEEEAEEVQAPGTPPRSLEERLSDEGELVDEQEPWVLVADGGGSAHSESPSDGSPVQAPAPEEDGVLEAVQEAAAAGSQQVSQPPTASPHSHAPTRDCESIARLAPVPHPKSSGAFPPPSLPPPSRSDGPEVEHGAHFLILYYPPLHTHH
jgi:hypothetical protein